MSSSASPKSPRSEAIHAKLHIPEPIGAGNGICTSVRGLLDRNDGSKRQYGMKLHARERAAIKFKDRNGRIDLGGALLMAPNM